MENRAGEFKQKESKILSFLTEKGYDGIIIARRDNFAWVSGGAESGVVLPMENGFSWLYLSSAQKLCVSLLADGQKAVDELLPGFGFENIMLNWQGETMEQYFSRLTEGKRVLSDTAVPGAFADPDAIYRLHSPLSQEELNRYRILGEITEKIYYQTARQIHSGMTELDIKAIFLGLCARFDVDADVMIVGSDERAFRYRHPNPTDKKVERYVLLSPVLRKFGLHSNIARLVHIGQPPEDLLKRYEAACTIQAHVLAKSGEGVFFREIYAEQERLYAALGYREEWIRHGHGAPVGYALSEGSTLRDRDRRMDVRQAYEWYITISGVKSAELAVNTGGGIELFSLTGLWPAREYQAYGKSFELPEILVL